jgi:uncharacterized protein
VKISNLDKQRIKVQLGRAPRDIVAISFRGACGNPAVVMTKPRLADGTPFPTLYYLTCPRLNSEIGTLESIGFMKELEDLIANDEELKSSYQRAHQSYIKERHALAEVAEIAEVSAGGMPERVKCLHALVAHSLAKGAGVNPIGDIVLERIGNWCHAPCVREEDLS